MHHNIGHTYHYSLFGHYGLCLFDLGFYEVDESIVYFLFCVDSSQEIPWFVFCYHMLFNPVVYYPSQNIFLLLQFRVLFLFLSFPPFPLFLPLKVLILNFSYIFEYLSNICFRSGLGWWPQRVLFSFWSLQTLCSVVFGISKIFNTFFPLVFLFQPRNFLLP